MDVQYGVASPFIITIIIPLPVSIEQLCPFLYLPSLNAKVFSRLFRV